MSTDKSEATTGSDQIFEYEEDKMDSMREKQPWKNDVKYFNKCKISGLAAMKMLQHALAGVDKGRSRGTNPVEVMGLCIGKPEGDTIIVIDTVPLPVEGTETKVVADDAQTYMLDIMESLELKRKDRFVGWYHSHPFDVETYSHCHLSSTDVQTQFSWQAGIPYWCAIVVDPLRSLARQEPEFGCFRCFPIDHTPPKNICPDGATSKDDKKRLTRWGVTHHRYYTLEISYFMSKLGSKILNIMSKNSLWIRVLASSAVMEPENRERFSDRVKKSTDKITKSVGTVSRGSLRGAVPAANEDLNEAAQLCSELATEQIKGHLSQVSKTIIFNELEQARADEEQNEEEMAS